MGKLVVVGSVVEDDGGTAVPAIVVVPAAVVVGVRVREMASSPQAAASRPRASRTADEAAHGRTSLAPFNTGGRGMSALRRTIPAVG